MSLKSLLLKKTPHSPPLFLDIYLWRKPGFVLRLFHILTLLICPLVP